MAKDSVVFRAIKRFNMTFIVGLLKSQSTRGFIVTNAVEAKTVKEIVEIGSSYQYFG